MPSNGKCDLGLVEDVEQDDLVPAVPQVVQALAAPARVGEQVAEEHDQALAADHGRRAGAGSWRCRSVPVGFRLASTDRMVPSCDALASRRQARRGFRVSNVTRPTGSCWWIIR